MYIFITDIFNLIKLRLSFYRTFYKTTLVFKNNIRSLLQSMFTTTAKHGD